MVRWNLLRLASINEIHLFHEKCHMTRTIHNSIHLRERERYREYYTIQLEMLIAQLRIFT